MEFLSDSVELSIDNVQWFLLLVQDTIPRNYLTNLVMEECEMVGAILKERRNDQGNHHDPKGLEDEYDCDKFQVQLKTRSDLRSEESPCQEGQ